MTYSKCTNLLYFLIQCQSLVFFGLKFLMTFGQKRALLNHFKFNVFEISVDTEHVVQ